MLTFLVCLIFLATGYMMLNRQEPLPPPPEWPKLDTLGVVLGKALAEKHCTTCHQLPEPALLDKATWMTQVLPAMGPYVGISGYQTEIYPEIAPVDKALLPRSKSRITTSEWEQLMAWYYQEAPLQLPRIPRPAIKLGLPGFRAEYFGKSSHWPVTTLLEVDTAQKVIWRGDAEQGLIIRYGEDFLPIDTVLTGGVPVQMKKTPEGYLVLRAGSQDVNQERGGQLLFYPDSLRPGITPEIWLDSLMNPISFQYQNFDQRFRPDYVIGLASAQPGSLQMHLSRRKTGFLPSAWSNKAGIKQIEVVQANEDTLPDLLVLSGQSQEKIVLYLNQGKGRFKEKEIVSFPPTFGISGMFLADFNDDCLPDLLLTQGDQGNLPPIYKPYHGIRLFLNQGNFRFYPAFFFPQNGAKRAIALDADLDGDLDIASISSLPDYSSSPEESFLLLIQGNSLQFSPYTFERIPSGKWGTLTTADVDHDGDLDILIGNALWRVARTPEWISQRWSKSTPSLVLLRNQSRKVKKQRKWFWQ